MKLLVINPNSTASMTQKIEACAAESKNARYELRDAIRQAAAEDNCEAVILGCAGMTDFAAGLQAETHIPTIDGLKAAISMVEALVRAGFKAIKVCTYAKPREK